MREVLRILKYVREGQLGKARFELILILLLQEMGACTGGRTSAFDLS